MGKGYNNFMSKKPFHPASKENIKRVWMAEQRSIDAKKKEEEMRIQYEKEQDLYNNRLLVAGSDSKDKLSLNFMYEAPPGVKKETKDLESESEPQYKFEWQRNAPRESFAKNNMDIRDQPFGIQVRNVRCLKCHKWGHVNTDRECPLFNSLTIQSTSTNIPTEKSTESDSRGPIKMEPTELIASMKEERGLALKKSLYGNYGGESMINNDHHQILATARKSPEVAFLEALSSKEKKRLLKKLQKLIEIKSKPQHDSKRKNKKHKKEKNQKKSKKNRKERESSENKSESEKHRIQLKHNRESRNSNDKLPRKEHHRLSKNEINDRDDRRHCSHYR